MPLEFVEIWNKNSGARISTYVILGERGSRCCIVNGAAARTCQRGDELIICNSIYLPDESIAGLSPAVVTLDEDNNIVETLRYCVGRDGAGRYQFANFSTTRERDSRFRCARARAKATNISPARCHSEILNANGFLKQRDWIGV